MQCNARAFTPAKNIYNYQVSSGWDLLEFKLVCFKNTFNRKYIYIYIYSHSTVNNQIISQSTKTYYELFL